MLESIKLRPQSFKTPDATNTKWLSKRMYAHTLAMNYTVRTFDLKMKI